MSLVKRYRFLLLLVIVMGIMMAVNRELGLKAVSITGFSFKEMALVLPPIFILLGLLDVWVPREIMMRYMGEGSKLKGIILAFIIGSAAAGPLYGAFPIAAMFMKKGVKFSNVLIFIGAWSTTKIPMFLFELSALGARFAITRLLVNIPSIILIAYILSAIVSQEEVKEIYTRAQSM
ncbi:MAG: permease [bacterium]|jgi:uncharacterized membrane protein YraQ (UPF0718 family)